MRANGAKPCKLRILPGRAGQLIQARSGRAKIRIGRPAQVCTTTCARYADRGQSLVMPDDQ